MQRSLLFLGLLACGAAPPPKDSIALGQGMMAGEVTATSAILQTRLTAPVDPAPALSGVPGQAGVLRFEYAENPALEGFVATAWLAPKLAEDFIGRAQLADLKPGTRYHYAVRYGASEATTRRGPIGTFKTLPAPADSRPVRMAVVSCFTYYAFHHGRKGQKHDIAHGYPALAAALAKRPDYLFLTGDTVYYDAPRKQAATTREGMRGHWQRELSKPRLQRLLSAVGSYWQKDDHDYRYNDADNTPGRAPSVDLGKAVFREQTPQPPGPAYRTHRAGRLLQIWLLESREYRHPNQTPDGPEKSLWGVEQRDWLKRTLKESDAALKLIITPTPLVGPDDRKKRDNHTNPAGFRHEGQAFLKWVGDNFQPHEVTVITGDRHWRYHSVDPTGVEEFSCGAICDAGSRMGRAPGHAKGTDPEARIQQPYLARRRNGGFMMLDVRQDGAEAVLTVELMDKRGKVAHRVERRRAVGSGSRGDQPLNVTP